MQSGELKVINGWAPKPRGVTLPQVRGLEPGQAIEGLGKADMVRARGYARGRGWKVRVENGVFGRVA